MTRVGFGFDLHPLVAGRPLVLGGVTVPKMHPIRVTNALAADATWSWFLVGSATGEAKILPPRSAAEV